MRGFIILLFAWVTIFIVLRPQKLSRILWKWPESEESISQPQDNQIEENNMDKRDRRRIEELRYVSQKENQSGNEGFSIFYMYILIITVIDASVSQLVADHFTVKISAPGFRLSPFAIDSLACILLAAAYIFSGICFITYFRTAKNQIDLIIQREKIKKEYDIEYKASNTDFDRRQLELKETDVRQFVPSYILHTTVLVGSLCLGGFFIIGTAAIASLITPFQLHTWHKGYQTTLWKLSWTDLIITSLILIIVATCWWIMGWWLNRKKDVDASKIYYKYLKKILWLLPYFAVPIFGFIISCIAPDYLHLAPQQNIDYKHVTSSVYNQDPFPESEIYVIAALIGIMASEISHLIFTICIYKFLKNLDIFKKKSIEDTL